MGSHQPGSLVIRADATSQIGSGHIMRCLALAQAWRGLGCSVRFVCGGIQDALALRIQQEGFRLTRIAARPGGSADSANTCEILSEERAVCAVLDGYAFDVGYQKCLRNAGNMIVMLDDYGHLVEYVPDLLLNQNSFAHEGLYPQRGSHTQVLLGSRYVLLRDEFLQARPPKRDTPHKARHLLVTLGGSDPHNVTLKVLRALKLLPDSDIKAVIVGGNVKELEQEVATVPFPVRLVPHCENMPELMAWSDMAVSAGGSTCWELAYFGVPHLTMVVAENQEPIVQGLAKTDPERNLGWFHQCSEWDISVRLQHFMVQPDRRSKLSQFGRQMIDGRGRDRVAKLICKSSNN